MDYKQFLQLCTLAIMLMITGIYLGFETALFHRMATFMIIAYIVIGAAQF